MSIFCFKLLLRQFASVSILLTTAGLSSAATLTISPPSTSNTFAGPITLQITGLTNNETVNVEKYLDLNGNQLVEANEPLLDAFSISESGISIIGGITNINVPFDSNSATDTITTTLSFALPLESIASQYVFRLVSPSGRFPAQNVFFAVVDTALNQSVNGTVYSNNVPLPNAIVVALQMPNGSFAGSVVGDSSAPGHYRLHLNAGVYQLLPVLPNYYADLALAPTVTLSNGMAITNNLFLTNGTVTISGKVYDAVNSNGLGGVFLQLESGDLFGVAFTDTNGNYSAAVAPGNWKVKVDGSRLARRAYVVPPDQPQVDTTTGNVANVNIALPKANALFYGRFTDGSNAPFANIDFFGQDNSGQYKADGFSDANGNYAVAVLANGGLWNSSPDSGNTLALANYIVSSGLGQTNISPGQALLQNFTALLATARISGRLQDNSGNPLAGVGISDTATVSGTAYNAFVDTDGSGNYSLPAAAGSWSVHVNCCGSDGLENFGLTDFLQQHSVLIPPTNAVLNLTVYPIGTPFLSQPARFGFSSFGFNLNGAAGSNYTVLASTNLVGNNWFTVLAVTNLGFGSQFMFDTQATNPTRVYRARLDP